MGFPICTNSIREAHIKNWADSHQHCMLQFKNWTQFIRTKADFPPDSQFGRMRTLPGPNFRCSKKVFELFSGAICSIVSHCWPLFKRQLTFLWAAHKFSETFLLRVLELGLLRPVSIVSIAWISTGLARVCLVWWIMICVIRTFWFCLEWRWDDVERFTSDS